MEKLKEMLAKDKKTSNLVLFVVLLVIVLVFMNYIFSSDDSNGNTKEVLSNNIEEINLDTETKLANIISKINGVDSASVLVTYSSTEKIVPVYDTKENTDTTKEEDKTSTKTTVEKTVAYEDENGNKNALLESKETAEATGAIVVVDGNITEDIKSQIKEAVAMVTDVPLHKIQIFVN